MTWKPVVNNILILKKNNPAPDNRESMENIKVYKRAIFILLLGLTSISVYSQYHP